MAAKKETSSNNNVVSLPTGCVSEGCREKQKRANFCEEHFYWFKEGLISRDGQKVKDFDKKFQNYKRKSA